MELPEKAQMITAQDEKYKNGVDELILMYHFKCCSCFVIFFTFVFTVLIWFPVFFFLFYCATPYKKVVIIDEIKNILIICSKGIIPCCKLEPKTYFLNNIKKVIIYITTKPDPKIWFKKLYFINCNLVSLDGQEEPLFNDIAYDDNQKVNEIVGYFRKHFETEFRPEEDTKNSNLLPQDNNNITTNQNDNYIDSKPSINEEAAMPIFA